jgi:hypothetical protein
VIAQASKVDGDYAAAIEGATVLLRSADAPAKYSNGTAMSLIVQVCDMPTSSSDVRSQGWPEDICSD